MRRLICILGESYSLIYIYIIVTDETFDMYSWRIIFPNIYI